MLSHVPIIHYVSIVFQCFISYELITLTGQAKIAEHYPCPYSSTALMVTMTSIQCTLFSLCVQKDWSRWKLGWNIRLLTAAYAVTCLYMFLSVIRCQNVPAISSVLYYFFQKAS